MKGGKREGAGRPKGAKNKKTEEQIAAVQETGITPLEYLLEVMRDESRDDKDRTEAAKAAAPYVHPKLTSTELNANLSLDHESALDELEGENSTSDFEE